LQPKGDIIAIKKKIDNMIDEILKNIQEWKSPEAVKDCFENKIILVWDLLEIEPFINQ
jgi:hypothetical protein